MTDLLTSFLVLSGASLILASAIGVLRLPDVLCRSHAVAKALTLGIFLMLLGLWVHQGEKQSALKIFLAIFFQVVTIPVGSHLIGLLALQQNIPRWHHRPMSDHRVPPPAPSPRGNPPEGGPARLTPSHSAPTSTGDSPLG